MSDVLDNNIAELDSDKGEVLLDVAAFQQWKASKYNNDEIKSYNPELREQMYGDLRGEASRLYYGLWDLSSNLTDVIRVRLFRYLKGESICDIAVTENPIITRQAVHKCLHAAVGSLSIGVVTARSVWEWGQITFASTVIGLDHRQTDT